MKIKRLAAVAFAVTTVAAGGAIGISSVASAHTPSVSVNCSGITVSGTSYEVGDTLTLTVNGVTQTDTVTQGDNGRLGALSGSFTERGDNTWSYAFDSRNNAYDKSASGTTEGCSGPTTTAPPPPCEWNPDIPSNDPSCQEPPKCPAGTDYEGTRIDQLTDHNNDGVVNELDCNNPPPPPDPCSWPLVKTNGQVCGTYSFVPVCGSISGTASFNITNKPTWVYGAWFSESQPSGVADGTSGSLSFAEDYNGGSVTVYAWIGGTENDVLANRGLPTFDVAQTFVIDTNCAPPAEWPAPTHTPVCGPDNDEVVVPSDTDEVHFKSTGWVNGELTVAAFWMKDDSLLQEWKFVDENEACPAELSSEGSAVLCGTSLVVTVTASENLAFGVAYLEFDSLGDPTISGNVAVWNATVAENEARPIDYNVETADHRSSSGSLTIVQGDDCDGGETTTVPPTTAPPTTEPPVTTAPPTTTPVVTTVPPTTAPPTTAPVATTVPPTTPTTQAPPSGELPATGGETGLIVALATIALVGGAALTWFSRRKVTS